MSVRAALAWSYGAQAFIFIQTFAASVVVARLLGPYEMGVFAVGVSATGVLAILSSFGVASYLVRHDAPDATVRATAFTVNAILNLLVAGGIVALVALGPLFDLDPAVGHVLMLLAIAPLIGIFEFLPSTLMQREMNFRSISIVSMGRAVVNSALLLAFAWRGLGSLGLAMAAVGSSLFSMLAFNAVAWRHASLRVALTGWRDLTTFGLQMMSIGGLALLVQRVCELILSRFLGIAALGIYSRASSVASQIWDNVYGLATRVIFAQMAEEMRRRGTVRQTFIHGLAMLTGLVGPLVAGIAVLSPPLIHVLYGDRWLAAAAPLSLLMLVFFVALGFGMNWELCVLQKRTGWQARVEASRALVGLVAFATGASISPAGAAAGRVVESLYGLALFGPKMRELAGTEPGEIARVYRDSVLLTGVAVGPATVVMGVGGWSPTTPLAWIIGAVVAGIGLWSVALGLLDHPLGSEIARVSRRLRAPFRRGADR